MKKLLRVVSAFSVFMLLGNKTNSDKPDFKTICQNYYEDNCKLNPLSATFNGRNEFNDQLTLDMTSSYKEESLQFVSKYEKLLQGIDKATLGAEDQISYGMMQWELQLAREYYKYPLQLMPLNQFYGTHLTMAILASGTSAQPFKTEKDYANFLKRMDTYTVWLDSAMVSMRKGIVKKVVLPKTLIEKIIPQFDDMITEKAEDNVFYSAVKLMPATFSETSKKEIAAKYAAEIQEKVTPTLRKMSQFLKDEYLPAGRTTSGIGSLPDGKGIYAYYTKASTTTELTPDAIHALGLKEVERIKQEMEKVKMQVGFKGTIKEFFKEVNNKKELKPFKKPEEVLANFEAIHKRIMPNVDKLFSLQPKSPFEIRRTESFREKTASAEYYGGNMKTSRPGIFYVPVPDVTEYNFYQDEDLFLHEAIPGHHFQISLQDENTALPDFRKYGGNSAYMEGWALYCETLGKELGIYTDPYQYFGMLGGEMHRAIRLVVDTGIHSKGWTREQAIQYSKDNEASSEAEIIAEVERYMAIPGQALSYKIGQMKILELRHKAELKMGNKFDIKKFHEQVLESGCLPLSMLEKKINAWIAAK